MNGAQFIRRLRKLGRRNGIAVRINTRSGKGSHVILHYGKLRTTVAHGEIRHGLLHAMCRQLGISREEL